MIVTRHQGDGSISTRHLFGLPAPKKTTPTESVIRGAVSLMFAHRYRKTLQEAREIIYPKDEATKAYIEMIEKAASAPALTTVVGLGSGAQPDDLFGFHGSADAVEYLPAIGSSRSVAVVRSRRAHRHSDALEDADDRRQLRRRSATDPRAPGSVHVADRGPQEGRCDHDVHPGDLASTRFRRSKVCCARPFKRTPLSQLNSVLLDTNPATAVRPAGLFNGITPITATTGGGFNALVGDVKAITAAILALTQGHIRSPVFLMNPTQINSIKLTANALGQFPFREEITAGNLLGYPVIDSGTVPSATVGMVDAADFVSVGGEAPRFEISDQATLHMDDTTPLPIVDGGTPAAPVRSLFQTDSLGLRMLWPLNWVMRRPVAAIITGVTWYKSGS